MSGLELVGVILAGLPLLISGLEHWREVAKVGKFLRQFKREYFKCLRDLRFQNIMYIRNLEGLLLPVVDRDEVTRLISSPGDKAWKDQVLQTKLEIQLRGSYEMYLEIIGDMNDAVEGLKKELSFQDQTIQHSLASTTSINITSTREKLNYQRFRVRFSLNEAVRMEWVNQLEECNKRLGQLLGTGNAVNALEPATTAAKKQSVALESAFKVSRKKSAILFLALQRSWQCSCRPYHYVHLQLEHRTQRGTTFEIILTSGVTPVSSPISWSWKELRCGDTLECTALQGTGLSNNKPRSPLLPSSCTSPTSTKPKKVVFVPQSLYLPDIEGLTVDKDLDLCQRLGTEARSECVGILGEDDESYHLHPSKRRKQPNESGPLTLDSVISEKTFTRRQRYIVALLLASSVAQLQETPWLTTGLKREHLLFYPTEDDNSTFPYHEPFICQGFSQNGPTDLDANITDCNFYALGILLLELCFARRVEDNPYRQIHRGETEAEKQTLDLAAAMNWAHTVRDEGGSEYASAVTWCFNNSKDQSQAWRSEIIKNVVTPLEICQGYF